MLEPVERRRPPDPTFLAASRIRYARNLRAISRQAAAAGLPVLFVLPITNLRFPPAPSMQAHEIDEHRFQRLLDRARAAFEDGRAEEALEPIEQAIEMSPGYAIAHYWHGGVLYALGRTDEAWRALQRAVDSDVRTYRMTSRLKTAFIEVMEEEHRRWVDLHPNFLRSLDPDLAQTLFQDHVHPTRLGHRLIADALLPQARAAITEPTEMRR